MRTTTRRGLAAGAGAAAVLVAGAASALAIPGKPDAAFWEAYYAQQGYEDVSCAVSVVNGAPGVLDVVIGDNWSSALHEGNEWMGVVVKVGDGYDVHPWAGYTAYHYNLDVPGKSPGNITHVIGCQAPAGSEATEEPTDDATEEPELTEEPTGEPTSTDEPTDDDGATDDGATDDGATDEETSTDGATGPAVETDGPSSPGTNLGMIGGGALVLAGAGAAGWAMRRRPAEH